MFSELPLPIGTTIMQHYSQIFKFLILPIHILIVLDITTSNFVNHRTKIFSDGEFIPYLRLFLRQEVTLDLLAYFAHLSFTDIKTLC